MSRHRSNRDDLDRLPKAKLNPESLRETLRLFRYIAPYRQRFFLGLSCLTVVSAMGLCFPLLAGGLIDAALHPGGAVLPGFGQLTLNQVALVLVVTISLQALAGFGIALSFSRVGQSALADLREQHDLGDLAHAIAALPHLRLRGLMAIPEPTDDPQLQRSRFAMLRGLRDELNAAGLQLDTLSMGMSHDLEAAIMEGASIVRIGTALFGERH